MATLFEKLGGKDAVELAVDHFYERVLKDDRINYFFKDVDMQQQRQHQKAFLTYAFGGSPEYSGKMMREAHQHLVKDMGLNSTHFDAVIENLVATLQAMGVSDDLIAEVGAIAASSGNKKEVLNQPI